MKIAITGKGGVGKTTFSGTLACILAEKYKVYAIDADPDMNLASSLGITKEITPISKMKDLIKERTGAEPGSSFGEVFKANPKTSDLPDLLSIKYSENENLKLMVMGTVEKGGDGCVCPASVLLKALMRHLVLKKDEIVILDMEAGIEHFGRKTAEAVDLMIVVTEPSSKSFETVERIKILSKDIGIKSIACVLNKVSNKEELEFAENNLKKMNLSIIGCIPYDKEVSKADMNREPLINYKNSKALFSIRKISEKVLELKN
ncbi:Cobyrinic acid ac-diamide synthase [Methanococcus vannielii SB]|uniref:Cobyrinic acid ac-diamide synthase n=1 Tax=Methanococcus vannielii (strain ATCC 35089 / DSM 1224 / JCM 13029 / OCM 148 / SB) TaxID=406327 RepID=A6UNZ0_METVS|nr:AAA family ATPase [Methanococcus vannielii]ABR54212.1 Cobyrinic acid ac-diamide synthase [Methanococcus vannielii SB]